MTTAWILAVLATLPSSEPHLVELRAGTLLPAQELDGAGLHLALGWRLRVGGGLEAGLETGTRRVALTALRTTLPTAGGGVILRADYEGWSTPLLLALGWGFGETTRVGVQVAGGPAWVHSELSTAVAGGPELSRARDDALDWMLLARLDFALPLERGALLLAAGWEKVYTESERRTGAVEATGVMLELGWRVSF